MVLYHDINRPLTCVYSPNIANLQGEKHVFFIGKKQLVPAGYVVTKNGLGGSVRVPNKIETPLWFTPFIVALLLKNIFCLNNY